MMFPWERLVCRGPSLKPCRTITDKMRIALSKSMLDNFWAMLEKGVDINTIDKSNMTPLHLVIYWKKDLEVVKAVLSAGADPNAIDSHGNTPLHAALNAYSSPAIIKALLSSGAEIETVDSLGRSPLMIAIHQKSDTSVITTLLSAGANVKLRKLMTEAVKAKTDPEVIRFFIMEGVSVNGSSATVPPLLHAIFNNDAKVVKLLLAAGASILGILHSERRCTMLHIVKGAEVAQELIMQGMDVNAVNDMGETPLHTAVINDYLDVVITLIKAGADVHRLVERNGANCLHLAESKTMVKMLVSHGVDINARNKNGATPLHVILRFFSFIRLDDSMSAEGLSYYEAKKKYISAIKEMLKSGADVNAIDESGKQVLELASNFGSAKVMLYLINYGLQIDWKGIVILGAYFRNYISRLIRDWVIRNYEDLYFFYFSREQILSGRIPPPFYCGFRCKGEIELMKKKKVNCHNTMYHYMVEIGPKIKALRLCSHYEINYENYENMFPIYKNMIKTRLTMCYMRGLLLDVLEKIDVNVPSALGKGVVSLINDCKFAIAQYLSNKDLFFFLLAMGIEFSKDTVCPIEKMINISQPSNHQNCVHTYF